MQPKRAAGADVFNLNFQQLDQQRIDNVVAYLRDEKIALKTTGMEFALTAKEMGEALNGDQLLSVTRWSGNHMEEHLRNLIELTDTAKTFAQIHQAG